MTNSNDKIFTFFLVPIPYSDISSRFDLNRMQNVIVFESSMTEVNIAVKKSTNGALNELTPISVGWSEDYDHVRESELNSVQEIECIIPLFDSILDLDNKPPVLIYIAEGGGASWFKLLSTLFPEKIFYQITAFEADDEMEFEMECIAQEETTIYPSDFQYEIVRTIKEDEEDDNWEDGFIPIEPTNRWLELNKCRSHFIERGHNEPVFRIYSEEVFEHYILPQLKVEPDPQEVPIAEKEGYVPGLYMNTLNLNYSLYKRALEIPMFTKENSFILGDMGPF